MTRRSFTLLEVLLALGLVVLLSGAVYGFLWNLLGQRDRMVQAGSEADAADVIVERLEADLFGSLAGAGGRAGISGDSSSIRVLSRGVALPTEGEAGTPGDLLGTEITWDRFAGIVRARRWEGVEPGGEFEPIARGVQRLRLRYFDGRTWKPSFDSTSRLPAAVEAAIWFGAPPERPETASDLAPSAVTDGDGGAAGSDDRLGPPPTPDRHPDRVRVMVVPDAPESSWREGRGGR